MIAEQRKKCSFPRMGEWAFSGKKTQCLAPGDSVFGPQRLSLFGEKSERGRLDCGRKTSERVIIEHNMFICAVFGEIRDKSGVLISLPLARGHYFWLMRLMCPPRVYCASRVSR